jgi:site-specific recombinase
LRSIHTIEQIWHYYITAGPKQFKFCAGVISNYISNLHAYLSNNNKIALINRNIGKIIHPIQGIITKEYQKRSENSVTA